MKAEAKRRITAILVLMMICTWCTGFHVYADTSETTPAVTDGAAEKTADTTKATDQTKQEESHHHNL